ncbi:MAG: hypothetical protein IT293_13160 [Deltaproteobacteria bacterium]|nr:hypothetical protein [Deltaproteobacteria bacterium]
MRSLGIALAALWLGSLAAAARAAATPTPAPAAVRWADGRLSVRVVDAPLDRVLAEIAAVTRATVRGEVEARPVTIDFTALPIADGLARLLGAESFMLTYAGDGSLRTIDLLTRGAPAAPAPSVGSAPSPRPPLAEEEDQAFVLQRPVAVAGPLAAAVGSDEAPVGRVLHAAVMERDPAARAAARDAGLAAFARDPEVEAAYLSTLTPVDDAVLARILQASAGDPRSVEEWMSALAARAPSAALRAKAAAVLAVLPR